MDGFGSMFESENQRDPELQAGVSTSQPTRVDGELTIRYSSHCSTKSVPFLRMRGMPIIHLHAKSEPIISSMLKASYTRPTPA